MNSQEVTLLVTLDLSAAFDTVNHGILIDRLNKDVGIQGKSLDWFKSYLTNRSQQVFLNGTTLKQFNLDSGVPLWRQTTANIHVVINSTCFRF